MSAKHTPGPWTFDDLSLVNVASFSVKASGYSIAAVWAKKGRSHPTAESIAEAKINARLIAAAPELLEQTKLFERCLVYEIKRSEAAGDDEGVAACVLVVLR